MKIFLGLRLTNCFPSAMVRKSTPTPREARENERHIKMLQILEWAFSSEKRKQVFSEKPTFWRVGEIIG